MLLSSCTLSQWLASFPSGPAFSASLSPSLSLHVLLLSFISLLPSLHPSIRRSMARWLLPIPAQDPWRGLERGCAPLGYWTRLLVKANVLWGGGWRCHHWLLLFTNEGPAAWERENKRALSRISNVTYGVKLTAAPSALPKCVHTPTMEGEERKVAENRILFWM